MSPRLFFHVWSLEARTALSYRAEFWIKTLAGFFASFAVVYFLWDAVFSASGKEVIGGLGFPAMTVYYLGVILIGQLVRGSDFDLSMAEDIYHGSLNRYLVFPTAYLPFKYAQHLALLIPGLIRVLLFGGILLHFLARAEEFHVTAGSVAMAIAAVAAGNLLHFLMGVPIQAIAYWADNVWSLEVAKRFLTMLLGGGMAPLSVFPGWAQPYLHALPFRFIFDFPTRVLLGQIGPGEWARGLLVLALWAVAFGALGRWAWEKGRRQYTGVGI